MKARTGGEDRSLRGCRQNEGEEKIGRKGGKRSGWG